MSDETTKLPAFPFYWGDWKKDLGVQSLDLQTKGLWWELLGLMWDSEDRGYLVLNGFPMTPESIARNIGATPEEVTKGMEVLFKYGVVSKTEDGIIYNRKMVRDNKKRKQNQLNGRKGGRPAKEKENPNENPSPKKPNQSSENANANAIETEYEKKGFKERNSGLNFTPTIMDRNTAKIMLDRYRECSPDLAALVDVKEWAEDVQDIRRIKKRDDAQMLDAWEHGLSDEFWFSKMARPGVLLKNNLLERFEMEMNGKPISREEKASWAAEI